MYTWNKLALVLRKEFGYKSSYEPKDKDYKRIEDTFKAANPVAHAKRFAVKIEDESKVIRRLLAVAVVGERMNVPTEVLREVLITYIFRVYEVRRKSVDAAQIARIRVNGFQ